MLLLSSESFEMEADKPPEAPNLHSQKRSKTPIPSRPPRADFLSGASPKNSLELLGSARVGVSTANSSRLAPAVSTAAPRLETQPHTNLQSTVPPFATSPNGRRHDLHFRFGGKEKLGL